MFWLFYKYELVRYHKLSFVITKIGWGKLGKQTNEYLIKHFKIEMCVAYVVSNR